MTEAWGVGWVCFLCFAVGKNSLGIPRLLETGKAQARRRAGWSASLWPLDILGWAGKQLECDLLSGFRVQACVWGSSCFGECFTELGLSHCQNGEEMPHCLQGSEHEGGSGWVEVEDRVGRKCLYGFRVGWLPWYNFPEPGNHRDTGQEDSGCSRPCPRGTSSLLLPDLQGRYGLGL